MGDPTDDLIARHRAYHDTIDRVLGMPPLVEMVREGVTGASRLQCCPSFGRELVCTLIYREDEVDISFAKAASPIWAAFQSGGELPRAAFSRKRTIRRTRLPQPLREWPQYCERALSPGAGNFFDYLDGVGYYHSIYAGDEVTQAHWSHPPHDRTERAAPYAILSAFEKLIGCCGRSLSWGERFDQVTGRLWFLWW